MPGQDNDIVLEVMQDSSINKAIMVRPICIDCKHFINHSSYTCKAFPKGIPDKILLGKVNHRKPLPRQGNDVVFEPEN